MSAPRNYLYISQPKIDALYSQIQAKRLQISFIDRLGFTNAAGPTEPNVALETKLDCVEEHLRKTNALGPFDSDRTFYHDITGFRVGHAYQSVLFLLKRDFPAEAQVRYALLTASMLHAKTSVPDVSGDYVSNLIVATESLFGRQMDPEFKPAQAFPVDRNVMTSALLKDVDRVYMDSQSLERAPVVRLEVLAHALAFDQVLSGSSVYTDGRVFATPIYVAYAA